MPYARSFSLDSENVTCQPLCACTSDHNKIPKMPGHFGEKERKGET